MQETKTGASVDYTRLGNTEFVSRAAKTWSECKDQMPPGVRQQLFPIFVALPSQLEVNPDDVDGDLSE